MAKEDVVERRVLVCFKKDASAEIISNFLIGIDELKNSTADLVAFDMHRFANFPNEEGLNAAVKNVTFPDLMTVWTFKNEAALQNFLTSENHLAIAKEKFKPAVEQRIVFNSRLASGDFVSQ